MIDVLLKNLGIAEQERLLYMKNDLTQHIPQEHVFSFLDMGCGQGTMSAGVLLMYENAKGTLVDIQDIFSFPENINKLVCNRYSFIPWRRVDELNNVKFDLVISTDVLEHIPNWRNAFRNLSKYLCEGGYLYIQTPSNYPSPNYPRFEVAKQQLLGLLGMNNPNQHIRHGLSCKQLFDEAKKIGLTPLRVSEDYVIDFKTYCSFKPRTHCLFMKK
jgi:2-polyprenyl-3-methyl-5-hydroxy-6-metoxy-1,4-benzoquinol methylase